MLTKRSQLFWNLLYKLRNGFFLQFFSKTIECHSNFAVISRVAGMLSQSSKCFTTCHTNNKKKKKRQRNQKQKKTRNAQWNWWVNLQINQHKIVFVWPVILSKILVNKSRHNYAANLLKILRLIKQEVSYKWRLSLFWK